MSKCGVFRSNWRRFLLNAENSFKCGLSSGKKSEMQAIAKILDTVYFIYYIQASFGVVHIRFTDFMDCLAAREGLCVPEESGLFAGAAFSRSLFCFCRVLPVLCTHKWGKREQ